MSNDNKELNLVGIKTKVGKYYITERKCLDGCWNNNTLRYYLINGKNPNQSFHKEWVVVDELPKKITKMVKQPNINHRYVIQDKSLVSDKLPEVVKREDIAYYDKDDCCWRFNDDMKQYRSLYEEVSDEQPDKEENIPFILNVEIEVDEVKEPLKMEYKIQRTSWSNDGYTNITEKDVKYQLADKIIFPPVLLPQRPCELTSLQTYKIVREYIKDNIDSSVATITSNFDFCFTVKKRIKLAKVKKYTVDVNCDFFSKRKRKPKYVEKQKKEVLEECFEMTHEKENYKGYTPIKGFKANSQAELKEKIDTYLSDLIDFINKPLEQCKHCDGNGVVLQKGGE